MANRDWKATEIAASHIRTIEKALEELKAATDRSRESLQDGICDYGIVGDLGRTAEALTELTDRLYSRGEYSPEQNQG